MIRRVWNALYLLRKLKANTMHSLQNVDYYRIILTLYCTYGFFNIKSIDYYMLTNYKRALFFIHPYKKNRLTLLQGVIFYYSICKSHIILMGMSLG